MSDLHVFFRFEELLLHVWCLCVRVSGSASGVWHMFTLRCSSGPVATDVHSLLADCLGAADTHHHHANNADREGTGIRTLMSHVNRMFTATLLMRFVGTQVIKCHSYERF